MSTYYDSYMKRLENVARLRMLMASQGRTLARPGPEDIALDAVKRAKFDPMASVPHSFVPAEKPKGPGGILGTLEKIGVGAGYAVGIPIPQIKKALDTSPARAVMDLLARGNYASAGWSSNYNKAQEAFMQDYKNRGGGSTVDEIMSWAKPLLTKHPYEGAWEGLTGHDKKTYSDVIREQHPDVGNKTAGIGGFALDVVGDPLNLVGAGTVSKAGTGIRATTRLIRPAEKAVEEASATGKVAESQVGILQKILDESVPKTERPKISVIPEEKIAPVADVVRNVTADALTEQIGKAPVYAHPRDLDIPAPFRDIEEQIPVETPGPTPKAELNEGQRKTLGTLRGVKAALMQDESRKIGKYSVGSLLKAARETEDPQRLKMIDKLFNDEAKRIVKSGEAGDLGRAQLFGRSGAKAAFGLSPDEFADLFTRGEIGGKLGNYSTKTDKFTHQFPIHSEEDLDNVFLNNARGQRVPLRQYLADLGVSVHALDTGGVAKGIKFPEPLPEFKFTPKTVPATRTRSVKLEAADLSRWNATNIGRLDKGSLEHLSAATTREDYAKRLSEIKAKTIAGSFKSLDEFLTAASSGMIPEEALNQIYKTAGVKSLPGLKKKITEILKKTGEVKPQTVLKEGTPEVSPKVQRIKGRVDPNDFGPVTAAEDVVKSGATVSKALPQLNAGQLEDLARALPWSAVENLVDPADIKQYPFLSGIKKAKRTSGTPGSGRARNLHGWNSYSQSDIFRGVMRSAARRHPVSRTVKGGAAKALWKRRAANLYDEVLPTLRAADIALERQGVKIISGTDNAGMMMSLYDVLSVLPRNVVENYVFMPRTSVLPTEMLEAADGLVRARMGRVPQDVAYQNAVNIFKNSPKIKASPRAAAMAEQLADALEGIAAGPLMQRVELNYANHGIEVGKAVQSMTDDVIKNVVTKYADPNVSIGEAFGDFAARQEDISKVGRKINAPNDAYQAAKDSADATLATVLRPGDFAEAKAAKEMATAATEHEVTKIGIKQSESRSAEGADLIGDTVDLGERFETQLSSNLFRANVPMLDKATTLKDVLGRAFVASYGHQDLHEALRMRRSVTQDFSRMHRALIAQIHDSAQQAVGADASRYLKEAFVHLQHGTRSDDEVMNGFIDSLKTSADLVFGQSVDNLGSFAQRNGLFTSHLNDILDYYHAPKHYRFDPNKSWVDQANVWRTWEDVDDPLTMLDMMHASVQRASVETTLGRDLSVKFGRATPAEGYVKVTNKGGASKLGRFIDKDLYYPRPIVEQMKYLDDVLKGSLAGIKNPTARAITAKYDSIIHAWKSGLTIYRPGHHVRNLIGDVTLAFFDGVTNPAVYKKATAVLATRSKAYQGWDGLKALEAGGGLASDKGAIRVGSKTLTYDQVWRAAFNQGIIPDYRTLEDIAFNAKQSVQFKAGKGVSLTRPLGGRGQRVAGDISSARDHWVRMAHFIDVLQKSKTRNIEEAINDAGRRVRKWHPDGSDLTNFESKYARRTFMFYSWMRKAIPLVVETLVTKPGRAMVFPKAMYALAEMNGVDLDSLGNPFPVDQLFPEFITDQVIGPQFGETGHYSGINPGEPVTELLSQWGSSDPQHGVGGALSPVLRVPTELYTGTNLGTGTSITDKSDYLDSQIPGIGYISKVTGRSVTGLGQPTRDVARGNVEPGMNNTALLSLLTGLGITNYSKPNYIRRAQLEQRDKAREEYRSRNG